MSKTLNKSQLARSIAKKKPWLNRKQAEIIVELMFETIARGVMRDGECVLSGFGKFFVRVKKAPPKLPAGACPQGLRSSEAVKNGVVNPSKLMSPGKPRRLRRVVYFKPHATLANLINS